MMYFLRQLPDPDHTLFLGRYTLPGAAADDESSGGIFCKQTGWGFEAYSLAFLVMNALAFLPCCLLLGHLGSRSGEE